MKDSLNMCPTGCLFGIVSYVVIGVLALGVFAGDAGGRWNTATVRYSLEQGRQLEYEISYVSYSDPSTGEKNPRYCINGLLVATPHNFNGEKYEVEIGVKVVSLEEKDEDQRVDKGFMVKVSADLTSLGKLTCDEEALKKCLETAPMPHVYARLLRSLLCVFPPLPDSWQSPESTFATEWGFQYECSGPLTIYAKTGEGESVEQELVIRFAEGKVQGGEFRIWRILSGKPAALHTEMVVKLLGSLGPAITGGRP